MAQAQNSDFHSWRIIFSLPLSPIYWWSNAADTETKLPSTTYLPFRAASLIHKIVIQIKLFNSFPSCLTSNCALSEWLFYINNWFGR